MVYIFPFAKLIFKSYTLGWSGMSDTEEEGCIACVVNILKDARCLDKQLPSFFPVENIYTSKKFMITLHSKQTVKGQRLEGDQGWSLHFQGSKCEQWNLTSS